MSFQLRNYQEETVNAFFNYYYQGNNGNIIAALPTATGKSAIIAGFVLRALSIWPNQRFIILSHVKKILEQDYKTILKMNPNAPVGIYSAGLNKRDSALPIIIAGVASVINNIHLFGHIDICIVDEAHLVSSDDDTMYQKIFAGLLEINPAMKIIGLSATPYRNGQGLLTDGPTFDDTVIDLTTISCFKRFLDEKYLTPLIPKRTNIEIDTSNVKIIKGDFAVKQLDDVTDKIIFEAIKESLPYWYTRNCGVVFCSGIKTSEHAAEILQSFGIPAAAIHSGNKEFPMTEDECDERLKAFEKGEIKIICGNEKFTTGYDFPPIDFCIMLRSTISPSKWVQMLGRLMRIYDCNNPNQYVHGFDYVKTDALVLDFAGNTRRLGPIDDVVLPRKKGDKIGEAPIRICEDKSVKNGKGCGVYNHASARTCCACGAEFLFKTKLVQTAGTEELIRGIDFNPIIETFNVDKVIYHKHNKIGSQPSIKVSYWCGLRKFTEYVCLQHKGYARNRAIRWWQQRSSKEVPTTTDEALLYVSQLRCPKSINVRTDLQYAEIQSVEW